MNTNIIFGTVDLKATEYAFILCDDRQRVFAHHTDFIDNENGQHSAAFRNLQVDDQVSFVWGESMRGPVANRVALVASIEDRPLMRGVIERVAPNFAVVGAEGKSYLAPRSRFSDFDQRLRWSPILERLHLGVEVEFRVSFDNLATAVRLPDLRASKEDILFGTVDFMEPKSGYTRLALEDGREVHADFRDFMDFAAGESATFLALKTGDRLSFTVGKDSEGRIRAERIALVDGQADAPRLRGEVARLAGSGRVLVRRGRLTFATCSSRFADHEKGQGSSTFRQLEVGQPLDFIAAGHRAVDVRAAA